MLLTAADAGPMRSSARSHTRARARRARRAPRAPRLGPRRELAALKADERLAIVLQAEGYSYAEIQQLCDWTYTKVNRCLAEGRARLRARRAAAAC